MLHALTLALADTLNFLLIGVLIAVGLAQATREKGGRYGAVAGLLVFGDWLGVLSLALLTLLVFDGLGDTVGALVESPVFALLLILTGVLSAVLAWRSGRRVRDGGALGEDGTAAGDGEDGENGEGAAGAAPAQSNPLVQRIMAPLKKPSPVTVGVGFVLGVVQSATSVPFFAGIAVISAGDFAVATRYLSMIAYASVALSLPFLTALAIGYIRSHPYSRIGRGFATVQDNQEAAARVGGYIVAVLLIGLGLLQLL